MKLTTPIASCIEVKKLDRCLLVTHALKTRGKLSDSYSSESLKSLEIKISKQKAPHITGGTLRFENLRIPSVIHSRWL
jgi:hypothetical protein